MSGGLTPQPWLPLPKGEVTGTDWSLPGSIEGADPYLAWAEADRFEGYRLGEGRAAQPKWLPVAIELHQGYGVQDLLQAADEKWLQMPKAYLLLAGLRFCTARVKRGFFAQLRKRSDLARIVRRFELGLPVEEHTGPLKDPACPGDTAATVAQRVGGKVMGIIDGGLAMAHAAFLGPQGQPRVRYFWRQDEFDGPYGPGLGRRLHSRLTDHRAGPTPAEMGYGHELTAADIRSAMTRFTLNGSVDEDDLYEHLQCWDLKHPVNHGTVVASLAAGPWLTTSRMSSGAQTPEMHPAGDAASQAPLIAVQLDWSNVVDTSGGAMNVSVLDALMYILNRVTDDAQVVVNISWGTLAGPHDGTSVLEAAIDHLISLRGAERLQVFIPAGNGYQDRTHANQTLLPGGAPAELHWHVQPDDRTQSFLELWLGDPELPEEVLQDVSIEVTLPGGQVLEPLTIGHAGCWPSASAPRLALIFPRKTALGRNGTCALLALCPTASNDPADRLVPAGVWRVKVRNGGFHPVVLDAYVERDDVALGTHTGARQSYFLDAMYDTSGNIDSFVDDPGLPTPIRRSGVFNSIGTGQKPMVTGGVRFATSAFDPAASYSPRLPDPDASRQPQRVGVKKIPNTLAVSDESAALWGVLGAGSRSGGVVRLYGTSCASPQTARKNF
ncbi:hypothetical protein [Hydrogenophaga sp. RWCD_12]|uniref:hypothetical protein n=1 Tax=Hydrogenophaga sp. RWCD_12 TaxID=3391190 RepID=UPI0039849FE7